MDKHSTFYLYISKYTINRLQVIKQILSSYNEERKASGATHRYLKPISRWLANIEENTPLVRRFEHLYDDSFGFMIRNHNYQFQS